MSKLITYLQKLKSSEDSGALAALRQGLSYEPGGYFKAYKYTETEDAVDDERIKPFDIAIRSLIGGLYALNRDEGSRGPIDKSLGATIKALYMDREQSPSIEQRFLTLLDSDRDQLPQRLRQMMALLKEYKIDWEKLLNALYQWDHPDRYIQRKWAMDFYHFESEKHKSEENNQ